MFEFGGELFICRGLLLTRDTALAKFYNANGESYARLDGGNSIYGMIPKTSSPLMLLSVFHFGAARQHLINIHTMFKDGNLNCQGWKHFVRNLRSEWQETILFVCSQGHSTGKTE
jgi:hypothetical protein